MAAAESNRPDALNAAAENNSPTDLMLEDGTASAESTGQPASSQDPDACASSKNPESSLLRRIIDTIPALAWCARPDGSIEFLSKQWHDYTGLSPAETSDFGYQGSFHPDDRKNDGEKCQKLFSGNGPAESEIRLRRYDGIYRWFLVRV